MDLPGSGFDEDLVERSSNRVKPTRSKKRKERQQYGLERAKDRLGLATSTELTVGVTAGELQSLQEADGSLQKARKWADGMTAEAADGYFWRDGLLCQRWTPRRGGDGPVDPIVLPKG